MAILTEPNKIVRYSFEGKPREAIAGQTIGAALWSDGVRAFRYSPKTGRPRGLFCMSGECGNCLMNVNGRPNVRACIEPVRVGDVVQREPARHHWLIRLLDRLEILPEEFYYENAYRPYWQRWAFETYNRRGAGLGVLMPNARVGGVHHEVRQVDVCVVGAGAAGLAAAAEASSAGCSVIVLERLPRPGGRLLFKGNELAELDEYLEVIRKSEKSAILFDVTVFAIQNENRVSAYSADRYLDIEARRIIVCTGRRERPFVFNNNDLPGIMLAQSAKALGRLYGVRAGAKAVVLFDHDEGTQVADELCGLGIKVVALVDPRPLAWSRFGKGWQSETLLAPKSESIAAMEGSNRLLVSTVVLEALGTTHLTGIKVAPLNANGTITTGSEKLIECDLLCIASSPVPRNELLLSQGMTYEKVGERFLAQQNLSGLAAAGGAAGTFELPAEVLEGKLRGAEAAQSLGRPTRWLENYRRDWEAWQLTEVRPPWNDLLPSLESGSHRYVCLCEDVIEKDVAMAVGRGFEDSSTLSRYCSGGAGFCQGKTCHHAMNEVCARWTDRDPTDVAAGRRPTGEPIPLVVLAAGANGAVSD